MSGRSASQRTRPERAGMPAVPATSPCGSIGDHRAVRGPTRHDRGDHMHRTHDPAFWAGRRVLVTGHTGFKGAWLTCWLRDLGAEVYGVSLPASAGATPLWDQLALTDVRDVRADVAGTEWLADAAAFEPEVVLHLAAQSLVSEGYLDPALTFTTNVLGTVRVLSLVESLPGVRARGRRDHRQGLRRPPADAVRRGRLPRRQGPLLREQGSGRARHPLVAPPRGPGGHRTGRQRDRRRRLRAQPHRARTSCGRGRPATP